MPVNKKQRSWAAAFDDELKNVPHKINAIDFIEGPGGTGLVLRPVQRVIVKSLFAVPFDYRPEWASDIEGWGMVPMWDMYREKLIRTVTEEEYLHIVHEEGRCNIGDWRDIPERGFNEGVVFCGRRGGKSEVVAAIAAYKLYLTLRVNSPQQFFGLAEGSQIDFTFLAQDDTGAGRLFKKLQAAVTRAQWFHPYLKDNNTKSLSFRCEADRHRPNSKPSIQVVSLPCTTNAVRGPSSVFLALDEFAHFRSEVGSTSEDMYVAATPAAGDFHHDEMENGKKIEVQDSLILSISSPVKKVGMMYDLYKMALEDGINKDNPTFCLSCSSAEMNPKLKSGFLKDKARKNAITFRAEYGGQFLESTESFVREIDVRSCVDVSEWDDKGKPAAGATVRGNTTSFRPLQSLGYQYFWGIDLGGVNVTDPDNTQSDASALAIGHLEFRPDPNPNSQVRHGFHLVYDYIDRMIVGEEFEGPGLSREGEHGVRYKDYSVLPLKEILIWLKEMNKALPCYKGVTDQHAGRQLITLLEQNEVHNIELVNLTPAINSEMAYALRGFINDRTANFPYVPKFIHEIKMVETDVTSKYRIRVHAPIEKGAHDDMVDAVMLVANLAFAWLDDEGHLRMDPSGQSLIQARQQLLPSKPVLDLEGVSMSQMRMAARAYEMSKFPFGGGSHRKDPRKGRRF